MWTKHIGCPTSDPIDGIEVAVVGLHDGVQCWAGVAQAHEQHGGGDAAASAERERRHVAAADARQRVHRARRRRKYHFQHPIPIYVPQRRRLHAPVFGHALVTLSLN